MGTCQSRSDHSVKNGPPIAITSSTNTPTAAVVMAESPFTSAALPASLNDSRVRTISPSTAAPPAPLPPFPWEFMVLSHQALFFALHRLSNLTQTLGIADMAVIRRDADTLFGLMKLHARIEDAVFFPAVEAHHPDMTKRFSDDHKRSGDGRPKLLALLDNASTSESAFQEAMIALRAFCDGNTKHQVGEEDVVNPILATTFSQTEALDVITRIAALDPVSFNTTYIAGIFARINDTQRTLFLSAIKAAVPAEQMQAIMTTIRSLVRQPTNLFIPVGHPSLFVDLSIRGLDIIFDTGVRPNLANFFPISKASVPLAKLSNAQFADRAAGAILGSIIGDALGTGAHWYYDLDVLKGKYGHIDHYVTPRPDWYHAGLSAGALSQTGEFAVALAESVVAENAYVHSKFCQRVDDIFDTLDPNEVMYSGRAHYTDRATRDLFQSRRMKKLEWSDPAIGSSWSDSTEGSQRSVVLSARYAADRTLNRVAGYVWQNSRMQYADAFVLANTVAFSCVIGLLIQGCSFTFESVVPEIYRIMRSGLYTLKINADTTGDEHTESLKKLFGVVDRSTENSECLLLPTFILRGIAAGSKIRPEDVSLMYGQSCAIPYVLGSAYYYAAHYQHDFDGAILAAVNAGGQTVSRCSHVGALIGAQIGANAIGSQWIERLEDGQRIKQLAIQIGQQAANELKDIEQ